MNVEKIRVLKARIRGISSSPVKKENNYFWKFTFTDLANNKYTHTIDLSNDIFVAQTLKEDFQKLSKSLKILEGSEVILILNFDSNILAIGIPGKDIWLDARSGISFTTKKFSELNIVITALEVF